MSRWGDEKTIKFIRSYRDWECLWDSSNSSLYKNKIARDNAYIQIQEEMNEYNMNMTVKDIKKKIKALRSTYHQELNKVKKSKWSGDGTSHIYKPSLVWFEEMDFLNDTFEYRNSTSSEIQQSSAETCTESFEQPKLFFEASTSLEEQPQAVTRKYSQNRKRHAEPYNATLTALERLENITTTISNSRSKEDEFYYFGQSVAAQLRSLPLNSALDMQTKIQKLISSERCQLNQPRSTIRSSICTLNGFKTIEKQEEAQN